MRNENNWRRSQSSWPGYDQRDDGWSDNRSERWAQNDWMPESEGDDWESARRRTSLDPWQLSEGGPPRNETRYGGDYGRGEYERGVWSSGQGRTGGRYAGSEASWRSGGTGDDNWRRQGEWGGQHRGRYPGQSGGEHGSQYGSQYGTDYGSEYESRYGDPYRYSSGAGYGAAGEEEWSRSRSQRGGDAWRGSSQGTGYGGSYGSSYGSGYGGDYGSPYRGGHRTYGEGDRDYEDEGQEHGPLYRLGRRIGEAVENLFGDDDRPRVGPKGYRRSDERVREAVCERLAYAEGLDVSDVTVDVEDGVVKLSGSVRSRSEKYDIEDLVEKEYGVTDVENEIRVRRNEDTGVSEEMSDVRNWRSDWT